MGIMQPLLTIFLWVNDVVCDVWHCETWS